MAAIIFTYLPYKYLSSSAIILTLYFDRLVMYKVNNKGFITYWPDTW